jgi:hypothetical protein
MLFSSYLRPLGILLAHLCLIARKQSSIHRRAIAPVIIMARGTLSKKDGPMAYCVRGTARRTAHSGICTAS